MTFGLLAPLTLAALALVTTLSGPASPPVIHSSIRIVDVRGAAAMVSRGASVLDARDSSAYVAGHVPGAQLYAWSMFMGSGAGRTRIRTDYQGLAHALAMLGVDESRPALVYGAALSGGGEEGHAAWLLALLGHAEIAMLDGGIDAWRAAGRPIVTGVTTPKVGKFTARPQPQLLADPAQLRGTIEHEVADVRATTERKSTGQIPGARALDWRLLLDEQGRVRSTARLRAVLDGQSVAGPKVILCCSNGVRSAFVSAVLAGRGVMIAPVLDGGMTDWLLDSTAPVERV
jgi:thiosulfate/3-mercaptopyruvate sulfurtransferase